MPSGSASTPHIHGSDHSAAMPPATPKAPPSVSATPKALLPSAREVEQLLKSEEPSEVALIRRGEEVCCPAHASLVALRRCRSRHVTEPPSLTLPYPPTGSSCAHKSLEECKFGTREESCVALLSTVCAARAAARRHSTLCVVADDAFCPAAASAAAAAAAVGSD
jgi:hypothetical protein